VNIEIRDLQRAIDLLRCSINEKEFAMKIAQTRLDERTRRLCVEVCFDEPMKGSVRVSVSLSVCLSVCVSISVSGCLCVKVSIIIVFFNFFFQFASVLLSLS